MMDTRTRTRGQLRARCEPLAALALLATLAGATPAMSAAAQAGQTAQMAQTAGSARQALSLDEALGMAERASEDVAIARAGVTRARGEQLRARSELFPQLSGTAAYVRTLKSEFQGLSVSGPPDTRPECQPFIAAGGAPNTASRLDSLESALALATNCQADAGGIDFSNLPFGRANTVQLGLAGSQTLYSGGRVGAGTRVATAGRRAAEVGLTSARAQLILDVTQAYYDAVLSDRLFTIARASLDQTETTLRETQLARQVGSQPEFELLRAQVTRDNQRPVVVQRRTDRELAYMRLKQILDLPLDGDLALTSGLGDSAQVAPARLAALEAVVPDTASLRAPVRQAAEVVTVQENLLRIAKAKRLPSLSVSSSYGRVAYPVGGVPDWAQFRTNWTVSVGLSVPLFTGGRIHGDELVAEANLAEGRLQLDQTRELAQLDTRTALAQLEAADASWQASAGTATQATRAYTIAEIRYREGISTQTELSESRLLLQQAQANRALAARDLQVARVRIALIRDLPLGTFGASRGAGAAAAGSAGGYTPLQPAPQTGGQGQPGTPRAAGTSASASTSGQTGAGIP
ncbi:MAG: TolC family protein [Gemmatimonadaceae bacterium]